MYVYVYMHVYVCVYVCMCICMCVCMYVCVQHSYVYYNYSNRTQFPTLSTWITPSMLCLTRGLPRGLTQNAARVLEVSCAGYFNFDCGWDSALLIQFTGGNLHGAECSVGILDDGAHSSTTVNQGEWCDHRIISRLACQRGQNSCVSLTKWA
jgi:hypothetical protein